MIQHMNAYEYALESKMYGMGIVFPPLTIVYLVETQTVIGECLC
jgi:hypothetical protein